MLKVVSSEEAAKIIKEKTAHLKKKTETVSLTDCLFREAAEDIFSGENIPAFDRSTVDGFAVMAKDTYGSSEAMPAMLKLKGEILMGETAEASLKQEECIKISTGGMLPSGADSVVMVEHTEALFDGTVLVAGAVSPFQNVTKKGDDVKAGEKVIAKGTLLSSRHIGILAAIGKAEVTVIKRPVVGIISSGDEIVSIEETPRLGQVRDINSHILSSLMKEKGSKTILYGVASDDEESFLSLLKRATEECDTVLISGGSSAGTRDMTVKALNELGEVFFHGIAIKPGKPTIFALVNGKPVFGLPGHPAAAYFTTLRFVVPLIERIYTKEQEAEKIRAYLSSNISSNHGREEILSVKLNGDIAEPIFRKSGVISVLSDAQGYIVIDRNKEGMKKGEETQVNLF